MNTKLLADKARYLKTHPEGVDIMCKEMEKMREDVEQRTILAAIRNLMESLKFTAQQAMDALKIPVTEQPKYMAKL